MGDRPDLTEQLLLERASASPPSPTRLPYADSPPLRTSSAGSDSSGPISQLSAAMRGVHRMSGVQQLPGVVEPIRKTVCVHYWPQYNVGEKFTFQVEVRDEHAIKDLISFSIQHFANQKQLLDLDPLNYLIRAADKKSRPKTHFPAFGLDQRVVDTQVIRFALCHRTLDEKAKHKLEDNDELSTTLPTVINEDQPSTSGLVSQPPHITKKKSFLCCSCFQSSDS